jgi:hypothetical protein
VVRVRARNGVATFGLEVGASIEGSYEGLFHLTLAGANEHKTALPGTARAGKVQQHFDFDSILATAQRNGEHFVGSATRRGRDVLAENAQDNTRRIVSERGVDLGIILSHCRFEVHLFREV